MVKPSDDYQVRGCRNRAVAFGLGERDCSLPVHDD